MLIVGYVFAIRSQRMICREVQVNLAYPLVLQAWDRGQDPRSFCVLTRQARALPRQQCPRRVFERGGGDMHRGGPRRHVYICPAGAGLTHAGVVDQAHPYRASKSSAPATCRRCKCGAGVPSGVAADASTPLPQGERNIEAGQKITLGPATEARRFCNTLRGKAAIRLGFSPLPLLGVIRTEWLRAADEPHPSPTHVRRPAPTDEHLVEATGAASQGSSRRLQGLRTGKSALRTSKTRREKPLQINVPMSWHSGWCAHADSISM